MARQNIKVPFGYEPEKETLRGSLLVFDAFDESFAEGELKDLTGWAEEHDLARVVLYPLHESTLKRMESKSAGAAEPYHVRLERLEELCGHLKADIPVQIDEWERKRKKYTPMETSLDFLTEKYKGPHFLGLNGMMANRFATYKSYETWIRKLRLLIWQDAGESFQPHPKLLQFENRWDLMK